MSFNFKTLLKPITITICIALSFFTMPALAIGETGDEALLNPDTSNGLTVDQMIKKYQILSEDNPNDLSAWLQLGYAYNIKKNYKRSLDSYDKAIALDPLNIKAWMNRSNALKELERFDEALASYDKVIEIDPKEQYVWFNRGNLLFSMKRHADALDSYDRATAIIPKDAGVWYNRGLILEILKRNKEALGSYQKAVTFSDGNLYYKARVEYMKNKTKKEK